MRSVKLLSLIIIASFALLSSACHTAKKTKGTHWSYMVMVAKDLKRELGDADVKRDGDTVRVIYPELAMFDFNKEAIKPYAQPAFKRFAAVLTKYDRINFFINGYTDNVGTDDVNLSLSKRRAENTKSLFIANGISGGRMVTNGLGSANPIKSNTSADGRQANRRVEFILYEKKAPLEQ